MAGRNAAQLRADATATGLFNGPRREYVGDGYSVPWEVAAPGAEIFPLTLYTYKAYLDERWKEFSRLHDWLYTPYGKLINATQVEADDALQEELAAVSAVDAVIVGNACRYFGNIFFGTSQVGYFGEQGSILANNIVNAEPTTTQETFKMPTKIVILFQQSTTPGASAPAINYAPVVRVGGWSESLYGPDSISAVIAGLKGPRTGGILPLLDARAGMLTTGASIIGVRLYGGGSGKGSLLAASVKGNNGFSDQPNVCLQMSATSLTSGQSRRWTVRGYPDADIKFGEYDPAVAGSTDRIRSYFQSLADFGWLEQTNTNQVTLFNIDATGLVKANAVIGFNIGNIVTLKNVTISATGNRKGGKFVVEAGGSLNTEFKIKGWTSGAGTGGTASITGSAFTSFTTATLSVVRASIRKIGRPFAAYRGRKSRKRKTA